MGTAKNNFITESAIENFNSAISLPYLNQNGSDIPATTQVVTLGRDMVFMDVQDVVEVWTCSKKK